MDIAGTKELKVDASGRFFLPKGAIDPVLGEDGETRLPELWICPSSEGCLMLVDNAEYRRMQKRVRMLDFGKPEVQALQRFFFGLTGKVKADRSGRITLSDEQRTFAGIEETLVFQGMGRRGEIWGLAKATELGLLDPAAKAKDAAFLADLGALLRGEEPEA